MSFQAPSNVMVIGVGGTGKYICTYLKKALLEAAKDYEAKQWVKKNRQRAPVKAYYEPGFGRTLPEGVKIVALDLDTAAHATPSVDLDFKLESDPVTGEIVSVYSKVHQVIQAIKSTQRPHPLIGNWLEYDDAAQMTLPPSEINLMGAGQQRQFSRLNFFLSMADPNNTRKFHLDLLAPAVQEFRHRQQLDPNLQNFFFVVGSIAGGVGAGVFLDVGQIVRYYTRNLPNSQIMGIFVLSKAFEKDLQGQNQLNRDQVVANSFGSLRELARFTVLNDTGYRFHEFNAFANPGQGFVLDGFTDDHGPFQVCFILDATRNDGSNLTQEESRYTVCPAAADFILAHCVSQPPLVKDFANTYRASRESTKPLATFGIHSFIFPTADLIKDFSLRLGSELQDKLLGPKPTNLSMTPLVEDFFIHSDRFYGQAMPFGEFLIGTDNPDNRLLLLEEILTQVNATQKGAPGATFDIPHLKSKLKLPKRYDKGRILSLAEYELPLVSTDSQGVEVSDQLEDDDVIKNHIRLSGTDPKRIIEQAVSLCEKNLGTSNDPPYDPASGLKRTYHGIFKYYFTKIKEIYGGYTDAYGRYWPGSLENRLITVLNREVLKRPKVDSGGRQVMGELDQQPVQECVYAFTEGSLATAIEFCEQVIKNLEQYEAIRAGVFNERYQFDPVSKSSLRTKIKEELAEREKDFLESSWSYFKVKPYLKSRFDLLDEDRWEVAHEYFKQTVAELRNITVNWKKVLDNLRVSIEEVKRELGGRRQHLMNIRDEESKVKVRTFLSQPGSKEEGELFEGLLGSRQDPNNPANTINRRQEYFQTVWFGFRPDSSAESKTGRKGMVHFSYNDYDPERYSSHNVFLNAAPFVDEVRDKDIWELVQKYQDASGALRYIAGANGYSTQLVQDLNKFSLELVRFDDNTIPSDRPVKDSQAVATRHLGCYANWRAPLDGNDRAGTYCQGIQQNLEPILKQLMPSPPDQGQDHRIVGLRMTTTLGYEALKEYPKLASTYREILKKVHDPSQIGCPVHIFPGEKYAAKLEDEVMSKASLLGVPLAYGAQFFIHLNLIRILDDPVAFKNFLWAAILGRLHQKIDAGVHKFAVKLPAGQFHFLTQSETDPLSKALQNFALADNTVAEKVRQELSQFVSDERANRYQDLKAYQDYLQGLLTDKEGTINHLVFFQDGPALTTILAERHSSPGEFSAEEYLEVLVKLEILRELSLITPRITAGA